MFLRIFILFWACAACLNSFSQPQRIIQQHCFGGDKLEDGTGQGTLVDNQDGTFIISGTTGSYQNGDITSGNTNIYGGSNFFIAKIDSQFNIIWKTIIGGEYRTDLRQVKAAPGGGYIVIGTSYVGGGDVTGNHGEDDVWVVKLGDNGAIEWQHCYGGSYNDEGESIVPDGSGGYVFVATTVSADGDVVGYHGTQVYTGRGDIWMVRIGATGDIISQKCLGGTNAERVNSLIRTSDGNYLMGGSSDGNDGDVTGVHGPAGTTDGWLVKATINGDIIWSKAIGGSGYELVYKLLEASDGKYLVVASTLGSSDGDVSGPHNPNKDDAWVLMLQPDGQLIWQKAWGGVDYDDLSAVVEMADHSFLATGFTLSNSSPGVGINNAAYFDVWMLRFNNQGDVMWGNTYGGPDIDYGDDICVTKDNRIIVLATAYSKVKDVARNHGGGDLWVFQMGNENHLSGNVFFDTNKNGIKDPGEQAMDQVRIDATRHSGTTTGAIPSGGYYSMSLDSGTYQVKAIPSEAAFTAVPSNTSIVFNDILSSQTLSIAIQASASFKNMSVALVALTPARAGFNAVYSVVYRNAGTLDITDAVLEFTADARTVYKNASLSPTNISGQHISWHIPIVHAQESGNFTITLNNKIPPTLQLNDVLTQWVYVTTVPGDIDVHNDTARLQQTVTGSYDPNDKQESNAGKISRAQLEAGEYLNYMIRFQNTGNDLAYNITVTDTLDDKLDWNTLQMTTAGHPYNLEIREGNKLSWHFDNIQLPDSNHNEPASHGYIGYRVKPKAGLAEGDVINNKAAIFFDYNLPVATNRQQTMLLSAVALPVSLIKWESVYKNQAVQLNWQTTNEAGINYFQVDYSKDGIHFDAAGNKAANNKPGLFNYTFNHTAFKNGKNYYRLATIDLDGHVRYSSILVVHVGNGTAVTALIYPNPATAVVNIFYSGVVKGKAVIKIFDASGKQIFIQSSAQFDAESYSAIINIESLAKGIYFIECNIGDFTDRRKLVVQ